jgi:hypothetical protein
MIIQKAVKNADYRFNDHAKFVTYVPIQDNNAKGSTGSTAAVGEGTVCLHFVKSDGTTQTPPPSPCPLLPRICHQRYLPGAL